MKPSLALKTGREAVLRAAARYGLRNVRVFGSAARGDDAEDSDLDLLVEAGDASLLDVVKAQQEMEDALGVRVDLLTPEDLPRSFRAEVLAQAAPV